MSSRLRACRCGRKVPADWNGGDCWECQLEFSEKCVSGEAEMEREHRRLSALMNRGLTKPGLDPDDPVVQKAMYGLWKEDQRAALMEHRQLARQLAAQIAVERLHAELAEE